MDTLRDMDLVRAVPRTVELRAAPAGVNEPEVPAEDLTMPTMAGHFSMFDTWYEIDSFWEGRFLERTVAGAFRKTLAEGRSTIKVLYDHGMDMQIGNKVLGPIGDAREDGVGAYYEVPLLDTSYVRDLLPGIEAGVYGSSFRFRVIRDEWNDEPGKSDYNPDGIPERTIKEVRVFEFGPVTFPANPDATAGVRSLTDDFYDRLRSRSPERVDALRSRVAELRGVPVAATIPAPAEIAPDAREAPVELLDEVAAEPVEAPTDTRTSDADAARDAGTSVEGAAETPTDAPALSHPSGLTPSQRRSRLFPFLTQETS